MTINLTDPANHPANDRLTDERLIRVRDALQRYLQYKNGGDMAYVIADAIKGLEELLVSREAVPVMYCSQETIAASKDGEHLLRTLSTPSGDCIIPLYTAASVIADNWIPVSERMPEREIDVQLYCADKKEQMVGYLEQNEKDGWFRFASWRNGDGVYCQPTHWKALMAAPQKVK
ncbi:DUF551 domain-containing protein [Kluyvera cryocrescens]|uniref:DUF551 domain-containing protein n=1 Tax=Kluyvera cryocrescens TaxID=580 RepID=UPI003D7F57FE